MNTNRVRGVAGAVLCLLACLLFTASFSGCGNGKTQNSNENNSDSKLSSKSTDDEAQTAAGALERLGIDAAALGIEPEILHDKSEVGFQLDMPKQGDTIAVVHTTMGDITMRFFPEQAPKAVTNFLNLAKEGKYNNTAFHRVVKDFIIQGGHCGSDENEPNGTSSYGQQFEDEFCDKLFNIRGAVSMANNSADSNGSQFFINQTTAERFKADGGWAKLESMWENIKTQLENYKESDLLSAFIQKNGTNCYDTEIVPDSVRELYSKYGGNAYLDGAYNAVDRGHTVFAQVIDGMDVVDNISSVKTDEDNKPEQSVIITSIDITEYSGSENLQSTAQ